MNKQKPLLLLTNDDGYLAKGIQELIASIRHLGEIVVVAPDGPRSGMSSAITSMQPIRVHLVSEEFDLKIYACTGTPVDCVKLAISELLSRKPDLVLSGINHGSNASICVLYSGTMGAAMEASLFGVPSIGFSLLDHHFDADFTATREYVRIITERVLVEGLPSDTCLNVNIPKDAPIKGIRICKQAKGRWVEEFLKAKDGGKNDVYWLTGRFQNDEPDNKETDEWALTEGYVSVVPIAVDMTSSSCVAALEAWEL